MDIEAESEQLKSAWSRYAPEFLDTYLVHGVENPCFNPQSVVVRSLLVKSLAPGQFAELMLQERLYSACVCTMLLALAESRWPQLTEALDAGPESDKTHPLPEFLKAVRDRPGGLPFTAQSVWQQVFDAAFGSFTNFSSPFESLWREQLSGVNADKIKVLEAACGSANDYRYFSRYGLDRFVDFTGVDICAANIANARRRCPNATFMEGNALRLPFPDKSFDYYLAFDLFEHLSTESFAVAIREAVRVTRRGLWLSFFQLDARDEHEIVPDPPYHRNILSIPRTLELLKNLGCDAQVIDLPSDWQRESPGYRHYNPLGRIIEVEVNS